MWQIIKLEPPTNTPFDLFKLSLWIFSETIDLKFIFSFSFIFLATKQVNCNPRYDINYYNYKAPSHITNDLINMQWKEKAAQIIS